MPILHMLKAINLQFQHQAVFKDDKTKAGKKCLGNLTVRFESDVKLVYYMLISGFESEVGLKGPYVCYVGLNVNQKTKSEQQC